MYDLIIIGGGPAGVAAGIYAARKKLKTLLLTDNFGGQSLVSSDIQNWIGEQSITGFDLAKKFETHLKAHKDIEIAEGDLAAKVEKTGAGFRVTTKNNKIYETQTVFVASGSRRRRLGVPGEDKFEGKGVIFCTTCDAPLFQGKIVAVVGGGNAGLEGVVDLLAYSPKVYLLEYSDALKGDPVTQEKIKANPAVTVLLNAQTTEITGDELVRGLRYKDRVSGEARELKVDGVAVEIGAVPNSDIVKGLVELNKYGEIVVDHKTQRASLPGIWAAGDVTDVLYKQNNVSAGDAVKAILNIDEYVNKKK